MAEGVSYLRTIVCGVAAVLAQAVELLGIGLAMARLCFFYL